MKVTKQIEETSFPKLMESTATGSIFIIGNLTGNGYPYISLNNGASGFFIDFTYFVDYNRKLVLEND